MQQYRTWSRGSHCLGHNARERLWLPRAPSRRFLYNNIIRPQLTVEAHHLAGSAHIIPLHRRSIKKKRAGKM